MDTSVDTIETGVLPPGTVHLLQSSNEAGPNREIILVPTPSRDPNDPLNWTRRQKMLQLFLVYFYTFSTGVAGTSTYSVLTDISRDTGITIAQLNLGTGFIFLLAGWFNLVFQPLALCFGRRHVYLISLVGCVIISEWTAWISSFHSWAAARILFGVFVAPVEVLPEISIPDMFFAHERGSYIGGYIAVLNASNYIAPLIAGFMNLSIGWRWVQHWCAILLGLNLLVAVFFQRETLYMRSAFEVDGTPGGHAEASPSDGPESSDKPEKRPEGELLQQTITAGPQGSVYDISSVWDRLALFKPAGFTTKQIMRTVYCPILILFLFPNITWAAFNIAFATVWYAVYNATASAFLSAPPYNFNSSQVGLTYLAPLFGSIAGGFVAGPLADWHTLRLAWRNGGVREPEQRLWALAIYSTVVPLGLLLWGLGAAYGWHFGILILGGFLCSMCSIAGGISIAYNVDCFKEIAGESMVSLILVRNTLTFAFNYGITPWIEASGIRDTFIAVAVLAMATGFTFLGIVWKGKCLRKRSAERYWRYASTQIVKHE